MQGNKKSQHPLVPCALLLPLVHVLYCLHNHCVTYISSYRYSSVLVADAVSPSEENV